MDIPFLTWQTEGCLIDLVVVPNARRSEVTGLHDGALRVRLAAQPVDGAANEALQRWLAEALGVPRGQVQLTRGHTSRRKRLRVQADPVRVQAWLERLPLRDGDTA